MTPLAIGAAMGGISVMSSIFGNSAISSAAKDQQKSANLFTEQASGITQNNLKNLAIDLNSEVGMALTNVAFQGNRTKSVDAANRAETNIYGNAALRKQAVLDTQQALSKDSIMQTAEAKMVDIQNKMRSAKYDTEARYASSQANYNSMMSQQTSAFNVVAGAGTAALQGYAMGKSLQD